MSKLDNAIYEIHHMNKIAARKHWINSVHPLAKLSLTFFYIILVVSFSKYDILALAGMFFYPAAIFILADLSFKECLWRVRIILPLVCAVGIANPFLDSARADFFGMIIPAGIISMLTLMMKGIFSVLASYLLIATTTIEGICYALRIIHVPKIMVTQLLLTYRYITVLLDEANRITQAYALRAPGQRGIHFKVWGSLAGQLLLKSIDRANVLYESMSLRGYKGEFNYIKKETFNKNDLLYFAVWIAIIILLWKTAPFI